MIERTGQESAFLIVEHTGQRIPLGRQRITLGRGPGNSVELDDSKSSRHHAAIFFQDGRYAVEDLDSANGTYVNGQRVKGVRPLSDGDKIRIGQTVLHARIGAGATVPAPLRRGERVAGAIPDAATRTVMDGAPARRSRSWGPVLGALVAVLLVVAIAVILFLALRRPPAQVFVVRLTATPATGEAVEAQPTVAPLLPTESVDTPAPLPTGTELPSPEPAATEAEPAATLPPPSDTPPPAPTETEPAPSATPEPTVTPTATRRPPTAQPPAEPGLIADFETFGTWKRGDEPNGTFAQTQEQVHGGSYAGKLAYDFPGAGNDYVVFSQQHNVGGTPNQISAWVYGDGAGHFLNIWVRDAGGQTWQFPLGRVQHTGWQQMIAWLDPDAPWPATHIEGADNGAVDYPVVFRALVLDDVPDGFSGSGAIYIDDLRAAQASPPPAPTATQPSGRVVRFWADSTNIRAGSSTVLHWHVENVRAIYLDGAAVTGPDGQRTVSPAATTTYRLRVVFAGGEEIYEVTITVS